MFFQRRDAQNFKTTAVPLSNVILEQPYHQLMPQSPKSIIFSPANLSSSLSIQAKLLEFEQFPVEIQYNNNTIQDYIKLSVDLFIYFLYSFFFCHKTLALRKKLRASRLIYNH